MSDVSDALRLSPGAFMTCSGARFRIGHVDAPYRVHEVRREIAALLTSFAEASEPDAVLGRLRVHDDTRVALRQLLNTLRADGILEPASGASDREASPPARLEFEIARTTESFSDIGRVYPEFRAAWKHVEHHTMSSMPLGLALWNACRYVVAAGIPGAIVECGVWQGGSMLLAALALQHDGAAERPLFLYDIFDQSPEAPTDRDGLLIPPADPAYVHVSAAAPPLALPSLAGRAWEEDVVRRLVEAGYARDKIRTVRGRVQETIPNCIPEQIAVLRLDTDYYDSTLHELQHLFPRLATDGVLLVDDYGRLDGATRAVRDYFAERRTPILLHRIESQGCIGLKRAP